MLTVMTWYWKQEASQFNYTPEHVNRWGDMISANLTLPHRLVCVTDTPEGIDKNITIIPLPHDLDHIRSPLWEAGKGFPQCYRRLMMFAPDAGKRFGWRFVSMDLDVHVSSSLDPLFDRDDDFIITQGKSPARPYNGSMLMMTAGVRPQVIEKLNADTITHSSKLYIGSDQAWLSYCLGWCENVWTEKDGVYFRSPMKATKFMKHPPAGMKLIFFAGNNAVKPINGSVNTAHPKPILERLGIKTSTTKRISRNMLDRKEGKKKPLRQVRRKNGSISPNPWADAVERAQANR